MHGSIPPSLTLSTHPLVRPSIHPSTHTHSLSHRRPTPWTATRSGPARRSLRPPSALRRRCRQWMRCVMYECICVCVSVRLAFSSPFIPPSPPSHTHIAIPPSLTHTNRSSPAAPATPSSPAAPPGTTRAATASRCCPPMRACRRGMWDVRVYVLPFCMWRHVCWLAGGVHACNRASLARIPSIGPPRPPTHAFYHNTSTRGLLLPELRGRRRPTRRGEVGALAGHGHRLRLAPRYVVHVCSQMLGTKRAYGTGGLVFLPYPHSRTRRGNWYQSHPSSPPSTQHTTTGNGTEEILTAQRSSAFQFISLHAADIFPHTGQSADPSRFPHLVNIPIPAPLTPSKYRRAWAQVCVGEKGHCVSPEALTERMDYIVSFCLSLASVCF